MHTFRSRVSPVAQRASYNGDGQTIYFKVEQEKTMADNECGCGSCECGSSGSGIGWFLAGLGIGAVIGVLYAPKAGKETREDLLNGAREARDKAAELVEQGKQKAAELVEEGKQKAQESFDKGREYYDKGRTQWTQYVEKGKSLINEQQAKVEAAVDAGKEAYINTTTEPQV
jgi:gas vesicle protein